MNGLFCDFMQWDLYLNGRRSARTKEEAARRRQELERRREELERQKGELRTIEEERANQKW